MRSDTLVSGNPLSRWLSNRGLIFKILLPVVFTMLISFAVGNISGYTNMMSAQISEELVKHNFAAAGQLTELSQAVAANRADFVGQIGAALATGGQPATITATTDGAVDAALAGYRKPRRWAPPVRTPSAPSGPRI